jgi:hypothetical protein
MNVEVVGFRFLSGVDDELTASSPHSDVSIVKRPTSFGVGRITGFRCVLCTHPERKTAATRCGSHPPR